MNSNDEDYEKIRKNMIRGETPIDITNKCLKVCADYLGGVWTKINDKNLVVERITGGFTNQLYYCGLTKDTIIHSNEPKEVAVKFHSKKWFGTYEGNEHLNDIIINILVSEHNLGAKLYGIFNGGEILEYIKSHQFGFNDQNNPKYVERLSRMLAQIHSLEVPIARTGNWLFEFLDDFYQKAYELFPIDDLLREVNANTLLNTNLKEEIEWLKKCIKESNSPIVFSHNDFRGSNILVRELDNNQRAVDSNIIRICDFEYSCYYYRGFDFGAVFEDWGKTAFEIIPFPCDSIIEVFMKTYLDECVKIHGESFLSNKFNSMKQLLKEAKVFALAEQMFFIMFLLRSEDLPHNWTKKDALVKGDQSLSHYFKLKEQFLSEGVISSFI